MIINGKNIQVFACGTGVGKTYLAQHNSSFVDMDQEKTFCKYLVDRNIDKFLLEQTKGNRNFAKNTKYPQNYYDLFFKLLKDGKNLLVVPREDVIDFLIKNKIEYCLVYPSKDCKETYRRRMLERGNTLEFTNAICENMGKFFEENSNDNRPFCKIELQPNQFLSDVLK